MTALILVPVFDEAETVGAVVAAARAHGAVLVVDDGSRDGSGEIARRAGAEVIRHPQRRGKGEAILTGSTARRISGSCSTPRARDRARSWSGAGSPTPARWRPIG